MAQRTDSNRLDRFLILVLVLVILSAVVSLVYSFVSSGRSEKFTEFYVLGGEGKAGDYPEELAPGEEAQVTVGIINREMGPVSYRLEVRINGVVNSERDRITLEDDQRWEEPVSFKPATAGDNQVVDFLLYKSGQSEPYRSLQLKIDVKPRS